MVTPSLPINLLSDVFSLIFRLNTSPYVTGVGGAIFSKVGSVVQGVQTLDTAIAAGTAGVLH